MHPKFKKLLQTTPLILVDFYAHWCQPCKIMSPILIEVKKQLNDQIKIIKIDLEKHQDIASFYQVKSVPTLILFNKGEVTWRESSVIEAPALINLIKNYKNV